MYLLGVLAAQAQLTIPGADGSDGALVIDVNTVIDLSQAVNGDGTTVKWDTANTANAGKGIYDPLKWAVVFKYSSVSVAAGATVTFTNHPSRAPVVWLVSGDVTIGGTVNLDGSNGMSPPNLSEPGPGGFRGGSGYFTPGVTSSGGFGPGGASHGNGQGYGGSYGSEGNAGPPTYGNPSLVPLLGGSGGGGDVNGSGGGAGGGAILIACAQTLNLTGEIQANGGSRSTNEPGGGSGGGIRCVANSMTGTGIINATGGNGYSYHGGLGRIRIERVSNTSGYQVNPAPSIVNLTPASSALLWPPTDAPTVEVVSIGGVAAPTDPRAGFGSLGPDVALPETTTTQVEIHTVNVEQASQVEVRVSMRTNGTFTTTNAVFDSILEASPLKIKWLADVPVTNGYSAVQVKVIRP